MENGQWAEVDEQGRLVMPAGLAARFGLEPGARMRLEPGDNDLRLHRPVTHLAKVYVETTNMCNLTCTICIRETWDEPLGRMTQATFDRILESLGSLERMPTVFFGGLGEPLFHPKTIEWISQAKAAGARVELITNGTTLAEERARQIVDSGLDRLWVSIDGATPESYADVRLGAALPKVLANLARLRKLRRGGHHPHPEIGLAFVAMRRNIHDLPAVLKIARGLGAKQFMVTNVLPYTEEMQDEELYQHTLRDLAYLSSPWLPHLSLPKMDMDETNREAFTEALTSGYNVTFAGNKLSGANDVCSFIESGSISVRWDGGVSPCWSLLHNHISYLHGKQHRVRAHVLGNVAEDDLVDLFLEPDYVAYRQKVQSFGFAPCTSCGGCDLSEDNEDDCFNSGFPACGSCLWAQGVIQCP